MVLEGETKELSYRATLGHDLELRSRQGWKPRGEALGHDLNLASRPGWAR